MIDLHLHVGLHKTGTTYVQTRLMANRAGLAARGVHLMDKTGAYRVEDHAMWELMRDEGPARFASTVREAARAAGARAMMLSSEQFGQHLRAPEAAQALAEALAPHFRTRIYIWLRRQDTLRESLHSQMVKRVRTGDIRDRLWYGYDWENVLRVLEDAFGFDALNVRLYHDKRRADVFMELLADAGIDLPDPIQAKSVNVSPHRRETQFMSTIPKGDLPRVEMLLRIAVDSGCIADDGIRALLSPAERRAFLEPFLPGNARLADRYGLPAEDRDWLTSLPPDEPDWRPPAPTTRAERLCVWRACMARMLGARGSRSLGFAPALAVTRLIARGALTRT